MNSKSRLLFLTFALAIFSMIPLQSYARATASYNVREFATEANINNADLDASAIEKVDALVPSLQKRFCGLKIRPEAVAVTIGMVIVEWNITRICESKVQQ